MRIGFIGLGAMGFPMARHLAKEHEVIVWNRTREKAERHSREHGTRLAKDLADTAAADVIITMLPTSKEVDEIVDKLLPHVRRGTLWIDATSGDPNVSRETAKRLAASLGVDETQAIHHALRDLAVRLLPQYEADDGPLTGAQRRQIRKAIPQRKRRRVRSSLFEIESM